MENKRADGSDYIGILKEESQKEKRLLTKEEEEQKGSTRMFLRISRVPTSTLLCRHPRLFLPSRTLSDKVSDAYNQSVQKQVKAEREGSEYMTKEKAEKEMKAQRTQSASADRGAMPTKWQKFCLVLTRLYGSSAEIPQYVGGGTMNRMRDRMRVIFITIAIICSYIVYFYTKSRTTDIIAIDRAAIDSAHK